LDRGVDRLKYEIVPPETFKGREKRREELDEIFLAGLTSEDEVEAIVGGMSIKKVRMRKKIKKETKK
jgi:hypothetical protein